MTTLCCLVRGSEAPAWTQPFAGRPTSARPIRARTQTKRAACLEALVPPGPDTRDAVLKIRAVTTDDSEEVARLWQSVFPEYADPARPQRDARASIARKLAFGDGLFWLAEEGGRIVGTAMAGYDGHRGWLYSVGVHSEVRRRGVGRALVAHAEKALAARGCPKVNLQVFRANDRAQAFWRSVGYAEDEVIGFGKRLGGRRAADPAAERAPTARRERR